MDVLEIGNAKIELVEGNIVDQEVDAIVNAANTKLKGGGGVDGAIHRTAGPTLLEACREFPANENDRRCPTGEVRTTHAGNLNARFVIHAVGPFYNERYIDKARKQLREVHENALAAAVSCECESVAFPAISCGAYRFPIGDAARIALQTTFEFLQNPGSLKLVRFVLFKTSHLETFRSVLEELVSS